MERVFCSDHATEELLYYGNLINCRDMPHLKIFMENFLPNKVVVHLYLFRASMEHRIRGEGDRISSLLNRNIIREERL